jgi:hypothetical protein
MCIDKESTDMNRGFTFIPIDPSEEDNPQTNLSLIRSVISKQRWRRARTVEGPRSSSSYSVLSNEPPSQEDNIKGQIEIESHLAEDKNGPPLPPPITIAWRPKRIKIVRMPESTTLERTDKALQMLSQHPEIKASLILASPFTLAHV